VPAVALKDPVGHDFFVLANRAARPRGVAGRDAPPRYSGAVTLPYDSAAKFADYAHPQMLVTTEWLAAHLDDPGLVVAESDEDVLLYEKGISPARSSWTGTPSSTTPSPATTSTGPGSPG